MEEKFIPTIGIEFLEFFIRLENDEKIFWETNTIKSSLVEAIKEVEKLKIFLDSLDSTDLLEKIKYEECYIVIERKTTQRYEYFKKNDK